MASLKIKYDYDIDIFVPNIITSTSNHIIAISQDFGWYLKTSDDYLFAVFNNCTSNNTKFLEVSQRFVLSDICNDLDSYKVLEQCAYIGFDSLLKAFKSKFDWFDDAYTFSPLNEKLLKHDLGVMLQRIP